MRALISVIIPVYNMAQYLKRCIDSVILNSYRELEIICVNDGSTDDSLKILNEYKEKDSRVIVINQMNKGLSGTRNAGLSVATGDYIAFIDADDWIHKKYFELLLQYCHRYEADICACKSVRVSDSMYSGDIEENPGCRVLKGNKVRDDKDLSWGRVWGRLFKAASIKNVKFADVTIEDKAFTSDVLAANGENFTGVVVDAPMYYYYAREGSLTQGITPKANLQLCKYCMHRRKNAAAQTRYVYTREADHAYLSYRYGMSKTAKKHETKTDNDRTILRWLVNITMKDKGFGGLERCYLILLLIFPQLYSLFQAYISRKGIFSIYARISGIVMPPKRKEQHGN
jgi:glycosyltransferase involved in cell wall biosynthesis